MSSNVIKILSSVETYDEVAKTFLYSHIKKYSPDKKITLSNESEHIYTKKPREYWWNVSTATKVPHNKPDLIIWNWETKVCTIVEFSCPLDISTIKKVSEKLEVYAPLVRNLQIMYPGYKFEIAPIVVGAMGYVPKCLVTYPKMAGFEGKEIKLLICRMQVKSIFGSVKICKMFSNFNESFQRTLSNIFDGVFSRK